MTLHTLHKLLTKDVSRMISLDDALELCLEAEAIRRDLEEDGYEFDTHFSYESILKDLVPDFLVDYDYQVS